MIRFDQAGRKFQQSLWLCLCPTLRYITEIFTSVSSTELFQKHIFVHVGPSCSLPLPHSLFHKPSMWNHGNRDIFFCVSKAHKALNITLKSDLSDGIYMKTSYKLMFQTCLWFLFFILFTSAFSLTTTYLHYVIDQRVAEHPVQVDALILQNVLVKKKKKKQETLTWKYI